MAFDFADPWARPPGFACRSGSSPSLWNRNVPERGNGSFFSMGGRTGDSLCPENHDRMVSCGRDEVQGAVCKTTGAVSISEFHGRVGKLKRNLCVRRNGTGDSVCCRQSEGGTDSGRRGDESRRGDRRRRTSGNGAGDRGKWESGNGAGNRTGEWSGCRGCRPGRLFLSSWKAGGL